MRLIDADKLVNRIIGDPAVKCGTTFQHVILQIENAPTVDADPVKYGEWIEDDYGYFNCSECGFEFDEPENVTPFCQNCGARMDGDKDDS